MKITTKGFIIILKYSTYANVAKVSNIKVTSLCFKSNTELYDC